MRCRWGPSNRWTPPVCSSSWTARLSEAPPEEPDARRARSDESLPAASALQRNRTGHSRRNGPPRAVVQQLQQLYLFRAQIDDSRLNLGFVLRPQKLDAFEVDLRDVAGAKAVPADVDDLVVIVQVSPCQLKHLLGLKRLHKGATQTEDQVPLQVLMLRLADAANWSERPSRNILGSG